MKKQKKAYIIILLNLSMFSKINSGWISLQPIAIFKHWKYGLSFKYEIMWFNFLWSLRYKLTI